MIVGLIGGLIGGGALLYIFNAPHRDVQAASVDFELSVGTLVNEYLLNPDLANDKYLSEEGESKIIVVNGIIADISKDLNHQIVVLLKGDEDKAGVSCTFMQSTNVNAANLSIGQKVEIKGVIRVGASYDEDLEMFEDVILEKCDLIK